MWFDIILVESNDTKWSVTKVYFILQSGTELQNAADAAYNLINLTLTALLLWVLRPSSHDSSSMHIVLTTPSLWMCGDLDLKKKHGSYFETST